MLFRNQLKDQVLDYCKYKATLSSPIDKELLVQFFVLCKKNKRKNISQIVSKDINDFRNKLLAEHTPFMALKAMKELRGLFRYYKNNEVYCIHPSCITEIGVTETFTANHDIIDDMAKSPFNPKPKNVRNRELILRRINDPEKWSWGALGEFYEISKVTAYNVFWMHVTKYVSPKEIEEYQEKVYNTLSFGAAKVIHSEPSKILARIR